MERSFADQYLTARKLIDEESKGDPPEEPYRSKYAAKEIFQSMLSSLEKLEQIDPNVLAKILLNLHISCIEYETEELTSSHQTILKAYEQLSEYFKDNLEVSILWMSVLNHMSVVKCSVGEHEEARNSLILSEKIYNDWQHSNCALWTFPDIFSCSCPKPINAESQKTIDKCFIETTYFLAQVLQKTKEADKAAEYCLRTLKLQVEFNDFEKIDWCTNAATLSQYYGDRNEFETARHLLACAYVILGRHKLSLEETELPEEFLKCSADLDRIYVKLCLMILELPQTVVLQAAKSSSLMVDSQVDSLERTIPLKKVASYEEATEVYNAASKRLASALSYLTLDEHASSHADCILDHSRLLHLLTTFQKDSSVICKLYKRRANLLESLVKELNPTYFLGYVRKIHFELGESYSEMVHHKLRILDGNIPDDRHSILKVNLLIGKSIRNLEIFINTFRNKTDNQLPKKVDDDDVRPFIVAFFIQGRLHTQRISVDPRDQLSFWNECERCYSEVLTYADNNPNQQTLFRQELTVIREMSALIPQKKVMILSKTIF